MAVEERIVEAVKKTATGGKLSCTKARQLAEELQVSVKTIGEAADAAKVKIFACELGCF